MADFDQIVFKNKKYSDIVKEVYDRNTKKEQEIKGLIGQLTGLINNVQDATIMVPLIAQYMNISIKNDDNLVKLAVVLQKALDKSGETDDFMLTDEDKAKILEEAQAIEKKLLSSNNKGIA